MPFVSSVNPLFLTLFVILAAAHVQPKQESPPKKDAKKRIAAAKKKVLELNKEIQTTSGKAAALQKNINLFYKKLGKVNPKALNDRQKEALAKMRRGVERKSKTTHYLQLALLVNRIADKGVEVAKLQQELKRPKAVDAELKAVEKLFTQSENCLRKRAQPALRDAERLIQEGLDILYNKKKKEDK